MPEDIHEECGQPFCLMAKSLGKNGYLGVKFNA
jgi:hypothetical protein